MFDNIKIMAKISLQPGHEAFCPCLCGRACAVVFKTDEVAPAGKATILSEFLHAETLVSRC